MGEPLATRLRRIRASDLEQVRTWRNSPAVAPFMSFRETITPEMQRAWFASIANERHFYWVIDVGGRGGVGVANLKDVDRDEGTCEAGIYVAVPFPEQAVVGLGVGVTLLDVAFGRLGLSRVAAHVLRGNERAIRYNLALGYRLDPAEQFGVESQRYVVTPDRLRDAAGPIRALCLSRCTIDVEWK